MFPSAALNLDPLPLPKIVFNTVPTPAPYGGSNNTVGLYAAGPTPTGTDAGSQMVREIMDKYRVDYDTALAAIRASDEAIRKEVAARSGAAAGAAAVGAAATGNAGVLNDLRSLLPLTVNKNDLLPVGRIIFNSLPPAKRA